MTRKLWLCTAILTALGSLAWAQNATDLLAEFRGTSPAQTRTPQAQQAAYETVLDSLLVPLSDETNETGMMPAEGGPIAARMAAQIALRDIVVRAGRPGAEPERLAMSQALVAKLGPTQNLYAKTWLIRMLEYIGRSEAVPTLAALLSNPEPLLADPARRALQVNPSAEASAALRTALTAAATPAAQIALANAVGARRDGAALADLTRLLASPDAAVVAAAALAVGQLGTSDAVLALEAARAKAPAASQVALEDALLLAAEQLLAAGQAAAATNIYQQAANSGAPRLQAAGLLGLAKSQGDGALPVLLSALKGTDWRLATVALRALLAIKGDGATRALADAVGGLSPALAAQALRTLGERGDRGALPQVLAALTNADEAVKIAALTALIRLADGTAISPVGDLLATSEGAVQVAGRQMLDRADGPGIDEAILATLRASEGVKREEMVRALATRRSPTAVAALIGVTADSPSEAARITALEALAVLADGSQLPALVQALVNAQSDAERTAAVQAVTAVEAKLEQNDERSRALLTALAGTSGATRGALLRALGPSGSPAALAALRAGLAETDPLVRQGAIDGLAAWPTAEPSDDLLAIAKAGGPGSVEALGGYVRLVNLSGASLAARYQRFADSLALAQTDSARAQIATGLGEVATLESLHLLDGLMNDYPAVIEPAARSVVQVGTALRGTDAAEVRTVAQNARDLARDKRLVGDLDALIDSVSAGLDAILDWQLSPAYSQPGKDHVALFDIAFAPEQDGEPVAWTPIAGDPQHGGAVVFDGRPFAGDNKVIYAKAQVYAPRDMPAQLWVGSDDGVKVWVNGQQIGGTNGSRALTVGQDHFAANLKQGWNPVLVKITNGGGNWSFNVQLRDANGVKSEEFKTKAE